MGSLGSNPQRKEDRLAERSVQKPREGEDRDPEVGGDRNPLGEREGQRLREKGTETHSREDKRLRSRKRGQIDAEMAELSRQ